MSAIDDLATELAKLPGIGRKTALRLTERLESEDVTVELIKAGDHRLSTERELARIKAAVQRMVEATSASCSPPRTSRSSATRHMEEVPSLESAFG